MIDLEEHEQQRKKNERKKEKREKEERKKCPQKDSNLWSSAWNANLANHCATTYVLIGANRW